ncbi:protein KRI1 [Angomonas deanei]|uniref:KRI1-like family, putative n=1 Tax=Angomonas deanei TaxID=59799 RepID=A0A7G2C600_9TRYP|nr:protein KRI1 [Angomonas deanei]CAD2214571.1 KRI1-like family, putative [Angomonas deanei]|eukprot:EPY20277.1 protein KRI1 [Angomonas deanei]
MDAVLAKAAEEQKKKNPHALEGKAKPFRTLEEKVRVPTEKVTKKSLFSSSSEDEDEPADGGIHIPINTSYAAKYEEVKRKQELQKLTEKYKNTKGASLEESDEDEEDENAEDDDGLLLTPEKELAFAQALLAVRKAAVKAKKQEKDEESFTTARYFPSAEEQMEANRKLFEKAVELKKMNKGNKFTLADEYRRTLFNSVKEGDEESWREEEEDNSGRRKITPQSKEEAQLRKDFLKNISQSADEFAVVKSDVKGGDKEKQGKDSYEEVQRKKQKIMEEAFATAEEDAQKNEEETFIRNYFMNELWRRGDAGSSDDEEEDDGGFDPSAQHSATAYQRLQDMAKAEQEELFYDEAEQWERQYQETKYRHQEGELDESAVQVQTFPRATAADGLLRKANTTRKEARQRRKERLEAARQQQLEELKRLKHLKREEITNQRAIIAQVAGLARKEKKLLKEGQLKKPEFDDDEEEALKKVSQVWTDQDLDAPFDPEEFDKKMAQLFNDDFYDEKNVDEEELAYFDNELDAVSDDDENNNNDPEEEEVENEEGGEEDNDDALYAAKSLEEAKTIAAKKKEPEEGATGDADLNAIFDDPFRRPKKKEEGAEEEDLTALLYPSLSLEHLEEESFRKRRELDEAIQKLKKERVKVTRKRNSPRRNY